MLNDRLAVKTPLFRFVAPQQSEVQSIVVELDHAVDFTAVADVMEGFLLKYADNLLRYKGILAINGDDRRLLFQGVQRLYSADWDREWLPEEARTCIMVFIGLELPEQEIRDGFAHLA